MKSTVWLSCDPGVSGDYEGMYSWLENHGAKECGSNVALPKGYEFDGDLLECLGADVGDAVDTEPALTDLRGIQRQRPRAGTIGCREGESSPWTGFGEELEQEVDED